MSSFKEYTIPHKMPFITRKGVGMIPGNPYDEDNLNAMYSMAIEELGFDPSMVDRTHVALMAIDKYTDYLRTGEIDPTLDRVGKKLFNIWRGQNFELDKTPEDAKRSAKRRERKWTYPEGSDVGDYSIDSLKADVQRFNEEYDIYNKEGIEIVNKLLDRNLMNFDTLRALYQDKYQDKWRNK